MPIEHSVSRDSTDPKDEIIFLESEASDSDDTITMPKDQESGGVMNTDGSINWDCPCLGGMANGPCGEQFKIAFSCFAYSEAEPKGVDCIDSFKSMQDCFREHPDIYGDVDDDGDDDKAGIEVAMGAEKESPIDTPDVKPVIVA